MMLVSFFTLGGVVTAQLSTRSNEDVNVKLSARPEAGDMALTFALNLVTPADSAAGFKISNSLLRGDLLTYKYYFSSKLALRAGLRLYQALEKASGTTLDSTLFTSGWSNPPMQYPWEAQYEYKDSKREYILVPGIEYHFTNSNIFDVYAGSDLYLGFGKDVSLMGVEFTNGDLYRHLQVTKKKIVGLAAVTGFNIFIAQLPISVGLEYGWNAKWSLGNKTKHNEEYQYKNTFTNTVDTYDVEYYTTNNDPMLNINHPSNPTPNYGLYGEMKHKLFNMDTNHNVRINLNIYFGTKEKSTSLQTN